MIYADYARRKMHNVVKLGTAEGYPLVINNAEGKKLKDYTIDGNTEYGENLFNYTEPYKKLGYITADEDGWFDVTTDNSTVTATVNRWCWTLPNMQLKPKTKYTLFTEIAESTGSLTCAITSDHSSSPSQFTGGQIEHIAVGTYTDTITTKSSFDNSTNMLRSCVIFGAGASGHIKFRVAVYETQKNEFIPYTKTSVGDLTDNLFNYTEPLTNSIKADTGGWFDVAIDNTDGTATKYVPCYTNANENLKPDTTYSIFVEIAEISTDVKCYAISNNITQTSTGQFVSNSILSNTTGIQKFTNKTRTSFDNCANMLRTIVFAEAGKSGHIKFRIAVYETEKGYFEPYNKYKIPIVVNGTNNETIYLNAPLADGESINYKADNLPDIVLNKGSNTITTDTAVKPKKIIAKYYKK